MNKILFPVPTVSLVMMEISSASPVLERIEALVNTQCHVEAHNLIARIYCMLCQAARGCVTAWPGPGGRTVGSGRPALPARTSTSGLAD